MAPVLRSFTFGKLRGAPFSSPGPITTLSFFAGHYIDKIILNGVEYGGGGGSPTNTIVLDGGDVISKIWIRAGDVIDHIQILTDQGQILRTGGGGGDPYFLEGRVMALSGEIGGGLPVVSRLTVTILTEMRRPQ
jgi:hypothetical protein